MIVAAPIHLTGVAADKSGGNQSPGSCLVDVQSRILPVGSISPPRAMGELAVVGVEELRASVIGFAFRLQARGPLSATSVFSIRSCSVIRF